MGNIKPGYFKLMWPFKKKNQIEEISVNPINSIICIPGNWNDWEEFILAIVSTSDGQYIAAANMLYDVKEKQHVSIEFCSCDQRMKESFKYAGKVTHVSNDFLEEIGAHKNVIYLSAPTGNFIGAKNIALSASAVLIAGGIGIKIETAGKAFEKSKWLSLTEAFEEHYLYEMFVIDSIIDEVGTVHSCGMHNLGLRDTIISGEEFQGAVSLISLFGYYQIIDNPTIKSNQTFRADQESPRYKITEESNQPYKGHELFENPFGMWRLSKDV